MTMLLALLLAQSALAVPPRLGQVPGMPAQPPATMVVEPVAALIASFDADLDGRTSRAELERGVKKTFKAIDTDDKGKLGYIAFADWAERWLGDRNALPSPFETDADGDNAISLAELEAQLGRTFDRLDRDHDGNVTRAECLTIRATVPRDRESGKRGKRRGDDN